MSNNHYLSFYKKSRSSLDLGGSTNQITPSGRHRMFALPPWQHIQSVLVFGCGYAEANLFLWQYYPHLKHNYGIDISQDLIRVSQDFFQTHNIDIQLRCQDILELKHIPKVQLVYTFDTVMLPKVHQAIWKLIHTHRIPFVLCQKKPPREYQSLYTEMSKVSRCRMMQTTQSFTFRLFARK